MKLTSFAGRPLPPFQGQRSVSVRTQQAWQSMPGKHGVRLTYGNQELPIEEATIGGTFRVDKLFASQLGYAGNYAGIMNALQQLAAFYLAQPPSTLVEDLTGSSFVVDPFDTTTVITQRTCKAIFTEWNVQGQIGAPIQEVEFTWLVPDGMWDLGTGNKIYLC